MEPRLEQLSPFGLCVHNQGNGGHISQFSPEQIQAWVRQHQLVLFRGFELFPKQELALFAQQLGRPLQWPFGAINDIKVKPKTENYIFTDHKVPMHWDGAFTQKVPYIILFQCLEAPGDADGGGTTFAHTGRMLKAASAEEVEAWKKIQITYRTEKKAHYGGEVKQKLVAPHQVDAQPVLRYAEPVDDLNPVSLEVRGLEGESQDDFVQAMEARLYDPENRYVHHWKPGDFVLADNHTLLHGREAYNNQNGRHIQRVNLHPRPAKKTFYTFLKNSLTIRRSEFFVAEIPIFLIPIFLLVQDLQDLMQWSLYVGLLALLLLFNLGDMINCYTDYKLDSIYKSHLSNAVFELGKKNVRWQIILSGLIGVLLTAFVAVLNDRLILIPLTVVGAIIGLQYSMKPLRFKSSGFWQPFCLWGIIFFGPMVYMSIVLDGFPKLIYLLIFALYGIHQMGIILLNTAEDYTEDLADGLNTVVVWLGFHRCMNLAFFLVLGSGIGLQIALGFLFFEAQAAWPWYGAIGIFVLGWLKIISEYRPIIQRINSMNTEDAVLEVKKNGMKVPRWLKIGAYTFLAAVGFWCLFGLWM